MSLISKLSRRGLLAAMTSPQLEARAEARALTLYCGFDPTASSLHVGNLLGVVALLHFLARGHRVIALVGGATGLIGDPSGRATERPQQAADVVASNARAIEAQLRGILERGVAQTTRAAMATDAVTFVNNADFYRGLSMLDFVGGVGRHVRVSSMLAKESVRTRLDSDGGISYAEFSYQIFQAYDFYCLFRDRQCVLQIGGSDQWGNITAGIDLIQKMLPSAQETPFGLTLPLITDASGAKLGKSAGNALWLSPELTPPFNFYQFFVRLDDAQAERLLRLYTFDEEDVTAAILAQHRAQPHLRLAQKALAEQVTRLVHGDEALKDAIAQTQRLYSGAADASAAVPTTTITRAQAADWTVVDLAVACKLCASKSEARRLIAAGGLYVNKAVVTDGAQRVVPENGLIELRKGKKDYAHIAVQ